MRMKRWQNQIAQIVNLGDVATNAEAIKTVAIPCDTALRRAEIQLEWANNTHVGSKVWLGTGTKKAVMRDIKLGPMYVGLYAGGKIDDINIPIDDTHYSQIVAISPDVQNQHRACLHYEVLAPYYVHLWEPFDFDVEDATIDWTATESSGNVTMETSVVPDDGQGLKIATTASTHTAYISKTIPTIYLGSGEDWYLRCFFRADTSVSSVTATTSSATLTSNSPIICGAVNSTTYGFQLRLRGTQGDTDTYQIDLNYPKESGIGLISGTTNLTDDKWYMLEGVIKKGVPGKQEVALNTYLLATDGTIGSAVSEGTASNGYTGAGRTLTTTGNWGVADNADNIAYFTFYTDQVMLYSKREF